MKFNRADKSRAVEWSAEHRLGAFQSRATAANAPIRRSALRRQAAFTLAEVLAALLFMAIVIPVAMQGLRIASRAGSVAERKAVGARLAERKLNELIVTGQWQSAAQKGTVREGLQEYQWQLQSEPWSEDGAMRQLTVQVDVPVQGREYPVAVSTLVDAS